MVIFVASELVAFGLVELHAALDANINKIQKAAILRDGGIDDPEAHAEELETLYAKTPGYHPSRWYYLTPNYKGKYTITDSLGFRNDPKAVLQNTDKIAFFGGSTMFSVSTDQAGSIPAFVERKLNTAVVQALNYGIAGYSSSAELATFIEVTRANSKIKYAIFFDGTNEVSLYIERIQDQRWEEFYDVVGYPFQKSAQNAARNLLGLTESAVRFPYTAYVAGKLYKRMERSRRGQESRDEVYREAAIKIRDMYVNNVKAVESLARDRGITAIFILQPTVFSKRKRTPWEENLYVEESQRVINVPRMFNMAYSLIRASDQLKGTHFLDLSDALDDVDLEKEYFYDAFHVSSPANQVIAERMFQIVTPFLPNNYLPK